jgi:predicted lipid-binding transport protein (Tim44 family)
VPEAQRNPFQSQRQPFSMGPQSGGFLRSLAGGVLGGMLGGMLFRSLGFAGGGGFGGGFGLFDLVLLAGVGYLIYAFVRRKRAAEATAGPAYYRDAQAEPYPSPNPLRGSFDPAPAAPYDDRAGVETIRRTDPSFDEGVFREWCTDAFFRIQAAWMRRDVEALRLLATEEAFDVLRADIEGLRAKGQTNRLENISVRSVEVTEAWQERGLDYVTVRYLANLLDYSVDDATGRILSGSDREPVKFEEFWTWVRPIGSNPWKLSALQQVE